MSNPQDSHRPSDSQDTSDQPTKATHGQKPTETSFNGLRECRLDTSFRLCIRADWGKHANGKAYIQLTSLGGYPVLKVLSRQGRSGMVERIKNAERLSPEEKDDLFRLLKYRLREAGIDQKNRILISADLAEHAGLNRDSAVIVIGHGEHFEIWNPAKYAEFSKING
jgi:DNA-binding transcriptional regulator/RsmH inhibitor MraZ